MEKTYRNSLLASQYKLLKKVRDVLKLMDDEGMTTKYDLIAFRQELKEYIGKLKSTEQSL